MKIGIIANSLNPPRTGVGNVLYNVLKNIPKRKYKNFYLINYEKNNIFPETNKIIIKNPFKMAKTFLWYQTLPMKNELKELDIIHNPYQLPTFFNFKQKYILSVLDIIQILFPKEIKKSVYISQKIMLSKSIQSADKIISISHHTKNDIIKHFKIPKDKIKVIHLAANENYKPLNEKEIDKIKQKYNLNYPFILYVGTLEPRKNIPTLLKAFYKLKKRGIIHKLVITGKKGWKYKSIFETIEKLNLQKDVIFTGYVPDEDLPALYNAADLFVYPSIYEGFGLPPLEAMQCGTPVITSNTSSLPEVVGDAGIMVNPYDVDELANKMYEVLTNDGLREELSKKGIERAKLFSWKKCAEEHLKVYEEVYNMK
ncbi:glycosyltransferase family 4 protein [Methanococcus aeolicus]|uniref:glycosyltransferase family 4 protein n=1 Tax=Methanococcus aeolicus TaxID=42879 RepID=UPI0021C8B83B|nr:glycosyltransferase family 1 protein [Methanococcus aeolicus]UXM85418.1 glycosyltransferase family 4 protein [Methanococcus aeolicus]